MPTKPKRSRLAYLAATPWALYPQALVRLAQWARDETPVPQFAQAGNHDMQPSGGSVAIIPVYGVINYHADWLSELLGEATVDGIRGALADALNDPQVNAIVLDIDSPGGTVAGMTELASELRSIRGGAKPIVAMANTMAASAAYWLASAADEIVATPSAQVGSIGVYAMHQDISGMLAQDGIDITLISAGPHKVDGNMFEPLTDEARADIQDKVDASYSQFLGDVAAGRRLSVDAVRGDFGGGRVLTAEAAAKVGMVDRVETMSALMTRLSRPQARRKITSTAALANPVTGFATGGSVQPTSVTILVGESGAESGTTIASTTENTTVITDDAPSDGLGPFGERVAALAFEAAALVAHAQERARLRTIAGRPAFSTTTERSLRTTRDAIDALLTPDDSALSEEATEPDDSAQVDLVTPPEAAPPTRRVSDSEWLAYLRS